MRPRESERSFDLFGSRVRLLAGVPATGDALEPNLALALGEGALRVLHRRLSRFEPGSELSRLNADPRETVPVSASLAGFAAAAIESARRSGGLVDPTILDDLESAGYAFSRVGRAPADLTAALAAAPPRAPAAADERRRWAGIHVDVAAGTVRRPPGVRIDGGGVAKGYAADLLARRLSGFSSFCVDCGGDLRLGGADGLPREVTVPSPFAGAEPIRLTASRGGIATSGIARGIWRHGDGFAHHLIDPSRGTPAWTGLVQVTAIAPTATEAEIRAKAALLSGPERARGMLADGGVLINDDGDFELVGAIARSEAAAA